MPATEIDEARYIAQIEAIAKRVPQAGAPREERRRWYLLRVEPRGEGRVCGHLVGHSIPVLSPTILVERCRYRSIFSGDRISLGRKRIESPMFPGYVFVRLDLDAEWSRVRAVPGVLRLMESGNGPAIMPDLLITELRAREAELMAQSSKNAHKYRVGERVRVISGPFTRFVGKIERLDEGGRIRLLLNLFGRATPLATQVHEIEAI